MEVIFEWLKAFYTGKSPNDNNVKLRAPIDIFPAIDTITRLDAKLQAANEDAGRLAGCVQNVINISDEDSWPVSRRALEAHKERIAK